jgi:hypothetical protein
VATVALVTFIFSDVLLALALRILRFNDTVETPLASESLVPGTWLLYLTLRFLGLTECELETFNWLPCKIPNLSSKGALG